MRWSRWWISASRNAALELATGDYIGFVDSDDSIDPSYYEKLHRAAVQSGAEIAIGDILYFEADGSLSGYQEKALRTEVISGDEAIHRMRLTPFIHLTTRLHRRELFDTIRFPVGKNYEDAFTTPLILEQVTKAACVGEPLYHYKFNPVGIVRTKFDFKNLNEVYANYALLECAYPAVRFVNDPDTAVPCRCGIAQSRAVVRGAVVYQNDLKIRKGLGKDGVDAVVQILLYLVHRHDNADLRAALRSLFTHNILSFTTFDQAQPFR